MKWLSMLMLTGLLLAGCATADSPEGEAQGKSPTGALVRGEITADQYLQAITKANEDARANEQFEVNKEPTRAYNTKTGRVEYIPEGTAQKWNDQTQRWEFTPVD